MVIRHGEPPSGGVAIHGFLAKELLQSYCGSEYFLLDGHTPFSRSP
jgi:hypothetical protein